MQHRELLGPADVSNEMLKQLVAALFRSSPDQVKVLSSNVETVAYDLTTITTAGRYWVRGEALVGTEHELFCFFVKHVQSWSRSPMFAHVPAEFAQMAEAGVPWRIEPLAYRSDLGERLPHGLRMPRVFGVFDLDEKSASIWLEEIVTVPSEWNVTQYSRAAYLLGRLAASPRTRERANVGEFPLTVHDYVEGRLEKQVFPLLRDSGIWLHPLVAATFDDSLRVRLLDVADRANDLADELSAMPLGTVHGDACPNNLLVTAEDDGFVLIDYGYFGEGQIGFDLSQLLVGEIQVGRQRASTLHAVDAAILPAYVEGLRAEGSEVSINVVRRAHALHLMLYTGLSTLPFDFLGNELTPALTQLVADRAAIARFSLELLDTTG